jgi:hypothetical protein
MSNLKNESVAYDKRKTDTVSGMSGDDARLSIIVTTAASAAAFGAAVCGGFGVVIGGIIGAVVGSEVAASNNDK